MTPNHAIFRHVFAEGQKVTDRTFDYLPDAGTQYPFIYVGESSNTDETNFDLFGNATQTVHIYATRTQRSELDNLTSLLLNSLRTSRAAYDYAINFVSCNQKDAPDNTDVQPLIHRVLDISFSYNQKGI
ncbi:TPA: hypothetical protein U0921_000810 [Streptococcus suis]|uniref:hypothetical protein n=1 Tax=Streptococcus suis TaxID=1307 RepID=UPI0003FDFAB7|nr:hypothetical protein [Streptococcus suis]QWS31649.1 hypothetical protein KPA27_02860 [Streptococcus suis]HEM3173031.1 hypothetical protein [Streptococcus suis]HEM4059303.1 hypothetical protein [Streptococcus suis]HEM4423108.1 hypothetical protein [Streptococcus suis]